MLPRRGPRSSNQITRVVVIQAPFTTLTVVDFPRNLRLGDEAALPYWMRSVGGSRRAEGKPSRSRRRQETLAAELDSDPGRAGTSRSRIGFRLRQHCAGELASPAHGVVPVPRRDTTISYASERDRGFADLYGAFPVKRLFWVLLIVLCSERERPFFVPSPAIRFPERAEGVKGPKR
jgi:hypothetical protein